MDEITKLKSEAYDILAQIQELQRLLEEKNQKIREAIEKPRDTSSKDNKK